MGASNRALFLFSKGVSHVGTRLFTFALSWYILSRTGSGLSFSVSLLVNYLPQIILSPFVGGLSDRTRRPNRILVLCDLTSAAPSIGGVLIRVLPIRMFAVINIASFLLSAFGELFLKYAPHREARGPRPAKAARGSGRAVLSYMFGQRNLRAFFLADSLGNFCVSAGINVALPLIVTTTLGISSAGYGLVSSSLAAGSVACALWRVKSPGGSRLRYPFGKLGLVGCCMLLLALTAWLPSHPLWSVAALCAAMFFTGWLSVDINIQVKTALQLFIDPDYLGKVLGVSTFISYILIPLSLVVAGGMSEVWPSFTLPLANGLLLIAILALPRRTERPAAQDES